MKFRFLNTFYFQKQDDGDGGDPKPPTPPATDPEPPKTFTQDELNTMLANEKKSSREKILKELGIEDVEEIRKLVNKKKEDDEANKSASDKLDETNKKLDEQSKKLAEYEARDKAIESGVDAKKAKEFIKLAMTIGEGDDLDAKIKSTLEKYPFYKEGSKPQNFGSKSGGDSKSTKEKEEELVRKYMNL